jgi:hypothetical protein
LLQRAPQDVLLNHQPVDLLVWDHSRDDPETVSAVDVPMIIKWLAKCSIDNRATIIVEMWPTSSAVFHHGPVGKLVRKAFRSQGYAQ